MTLSTFETKYDTKVDRDRDFENHQVDKILQNVHQNVYRFFFSPSKDDKSIKVDKDVKKEVTKVDASRDKVYEKDLNLSSPVGYHSISNTNTYSIRS